MKALYRNIFLIFGLVAVAVMLLTMDISYEELWENLKSAGVYLPLILLLWLVIYSVNTLSWWVILRSSGRMNGLTYPKLFKYSVSGFALNYVTPVGLMGGEPYRIMELTPYVGVERATASVILYVMMHIMSHFIFWASAVLLFVCFYPVGLEIGILMGLILLFCVVMGYLFYRGYNKGMAVACVHIGSKIPLLKNVIQRFLDKNITKLEQIDRNISLLHQQKKGMFYTSLFLEYLARIINCGEVWLILNVLTTDVSFMSCILILAFSSLMANLLFFMPMQLGGREGGFALAVDSLSLSGAYGVYAALITRVREFFWIMIGLLLMKLGNKNWKKLSVDASRVKAVAFDFGGTLDSPFLHWMWIYLKIYNEQMGLNLAKDAFRPSYVFCERKLEAEPLIMPTDGLLITQKIKCRIHMEHLVKTGVLDLTPEQVERYSLEAAQRVTDYSLGYVEKARPILERLSRKYTLLLVSNYYGNIAQECRDSGIDSFFRSITDSTVAGVRKPDPALWKKAIDEAGFQCQDVLIVGDSLKNDILPGQSLGCQVLKGCPEGEERPKDVPSMTSLDQILSLLQA